MALDLKSSLEIVKRAGFGSDDTMKSSKSERRMADSQHVCEQELMSEEERSKLLDEIFERIDFHRNSQNMTRDQLLDVDDL